MLTTDELWNRRASDVVAVCQLWLPRWALSALNSLRSWARWAFATTEDNKESSADLALLKGSYRLPARRAEPRLPRFTGRHAFLMEMLATALVRAAGIVAGHEVRAGCAPADFLAILLRAHRRSPTESSKRSRLTVIAIMEAHTVVVSIPGYLLSGLTAARRERLRD